MAARISLLIAMYLAIFCTTDVAGQNSLMAKFSRSPIPGWVKVREVDYGAEVPRAKIRDGMWWLHSDVQVNYNQKARFVRYAKKITTSTGVEQNGKVIITFDPQCQTVCLNRLQIHRGDEVIDRTAKQEVHFFGKRDSRELKLYDNRVRATMILADIRVGDIIEYAYTVTGHNPVLEGVYTKRFYVNSTRFIKNAYLRVLWPKGKRFRAKHYGSIARPKQRKVGEVTEIEWAEKDLDPPPLDDGVPGSYFKYRFIDITECDSWATVARWATKLFTIEPELPEALSDIAEQFRKEPTPEDRALKALRYVQMEIRYLHMGLGPHMVKPYPLKTIWSRRFGDCKDKTKLLCAILRRLGLNAVPVLVNTKRKAATAEFLPSSQAFNHVITRIRIGDKTYWVDPTRTHQGGTLATNYFPPYGWGLALEESTKKLTPIPGQSLELAATTVVEDYTVPQTGATVLSITWHYQGRDADYVRKVVADKGLEELQRRHTSLMMSRHADAKVRGEMGYSNDERMNEINVSITFETNEMWKYGDRSLRLYPLSLGQTLAKPRMAMRTLPFRIQYPNNYTYTINVKLPRPSPQYPAEGRIIHPAFEYTYNHKMTDDLTMRIHHSYHARSETVEAADMDDFRAKMEDVTRGLCYDLYEPEDEGKGGAPSPTATDKAIILGILLITFAVVIGAFFLGYLFGKYRSRSMPAVVMDKPGQSPSVEDATTPTQTAAPKTLRTIVLKSRVFQLGMGGLGILGTGLIMGYRRGRSSARKNRPDEQK